MTGIGNIFINMRGLLGGPLTLSVEASLSSQEDVDTLIHILRIHREWLLPGQGTTDAPVTQRVEQKEETALNQDVN